MEANNTRQHKVGIYCRLSNDDDKIGDSTSIINQKNILMDYVKEKNWLLVDVYIDDGFSGTNFNRPAFQRMIQDIEDKKIDCVIVKDQSRLGRNYIEVGNYTDYYFPKHNVRYIALSDGFDSFNQNDMDIIPFKNIMNEWYAKDTSKKIKAANLSIAKNGGHKTVWAPLGYKKEEGNHLHLVIDEDTAWIVRLIFDLADKGYGAGKISKELTDRLIPCPAYFIYEKHGGYKHIFEAEDGLSKKYNWYIGGVKRILSNKTYLGHSIHFRSGNLSYKIRKRVRNDKDDILIVENTHEPIISVEQYKRVQRLRESRTRVSKSGEINLFAQIIKCGTCGKSMSWYRHPGNKANNYGCREFRERGKQYCSMHYIREDDLKALVLKNIQEVIQKTLSDPQQFSEDLLKKMNNDSQLSINRNLQQKQEFEKKLKETDNKLSRLYDDYYSEKINIRNFEKLSKKFQDEQDHCLKEIENINLIMSKQDDDLHNIEQWIDLVEKYKNITELDFEIVHKLISKIIVHEREVTDEGTVSQKVEIIYNFIGAIDE